MADSRSAVTLDLQGLQGLLDVLEHMGFTVLGPAARPGGPAGAGKLPAAAAGR